MQVCHFCLRVVFPKENVVNLRFGQAHERCYLKACQDDFQKMFDEISRFPYVKKSFQSAISDFIVLLRDYVAKTPTTDSHKEFCNEWNKCNRTIMEFDLYWWFARHYLAQKSAVDRLISKLKGYPFTTPRTATESREYALLMNEILKTATDYSISFLPGFVRLRRDKRKGRTKSKEEYVGEIMKLIVKFESLMESMANKASKDMQRYRTILREDRELWLKQNMSKLIMHKLRVDQVLP